MRSKVSRQARNVGYLVLAAAALFVTAARLDCSTFTQATVFAADRSLRLDYSRLDHCGGPTRLRLWVAPGSSTSGRLRIRMNHGYTKLMRIDRIIPPPERVETGLEDIVFIFKNDKPLEPANIVFEVQPLDIGRLDGRLAVVGERSIEFTQYLIP